MGRCTFQEYPNQCHISHVAHNIVVSQTLQRHESSPTVTDTNNNNNDNNPSTTRTPHIVTSFVEALDLARKLAPTLPIVASPSSSSSDDIACWVVGGERLYTEALAHPSAKRIHLTLVDKDVNLRHVQQFARFPAKYRWDNKFDLVSKTAKVAEKGDVGLQFETWVYDRIKRK